MSRQARSLVRNCLKCKQGIWCSTWNEVKCTEFAKRVDDPQLEALRCDKFKRDAGKEERKCQCKSCSSRDTEDEE